MENDCPNCFAAPANRHITLGLLPCNTCKERLDRLPAPSQMIEIIPERIKAERQERQDSIEQPHFKGALNKRWVDLWGEGAARERGFSKKEIKNAKYVLDGSGINYYNHKT